MARRCTGRTIITGNRSRRYRRRVGDQLPWHTLFDKCTYNFISNSLITCSRSGEATMRKALALDDDADSLELYQQSLKEYESNALP